MKKPLALVVDDEPDIRDLLAITLSRMEVDTILAADVTAAKTQLDEHTPLLCLTDMRLPDGDGIELVRYMQDKYPCIPVAVITAHGNMELAVEALKAGAFDFVSKPVDVNVLRKLVSTALRLAGNEQREPSGRQLVGSSPAIAAVKQLVAKVARSQAPVYISGESGTGKELVARMIHEQGARATQPFIAVNCGAIPTELVESELFGHRKGSFTGAVADKDGLFQAADGGTLLLDEIGDLPLAMQVKLLRAIQEKSIRPVGSQQEVAVDVRILSATHQNLATLVEDGRFRRDLYYRVNVIEVKVPPLRERKEDIAELAEFILARQHSQADSRKPMIGDDALAMLASFDFPGNVRELENVLERASALCSGNIIQANDLALDSDGPVQEVPVPDPDTETGDLEGLLESVEKEAIEKALARTGGNKTAAAKELGISFRALRYRLEKLGLENR